MAALALFVASCGNDAAEEGDAATTTHAANEPTVRATTEADSPTDAETATTSTPAPAEPVEVATASQIGAPAATNSMNGIAVSPVDGNLYVASVGGNEITIHDPESGEILDRIGVGEGVNGPDDVFVTEDGTVYWTDLLAGNVGMRTTDGTTTLQFVGPGVNPITMSDDGRLFVARIFLGDGLYELDPMLVDDPRPLDEELAGLNAFDFGPDGLLYAPSFFTGEVLRIDVDADVIAPEVIASGFGVSSAAKFDSTGKLHVVGFADGTVTRLDLESGEEEQVLRIDGTIDNLAIDAEDRIFVVAGPDNQIHRIDGDDFAALGDPGFGLPGGVDVTADGTVWVGDFFVLRSFTMSNPAQPATSYYDTFAPPGTAFASASTVAADGNSLVVTGAFSGAVQVLDPGTGEVLEDVRTVPVPTNAIRHGERLVVSSLAFGGVVDAGNPEDVLIGDLTVPVGLASDGTTLYVGDWATGEVWAVTDAGAEVIASGLAAPEGIALDGGRLLVVETGAQRVVGIDLLSGEIAPVITGLDFSAGTSDGFVPYGMVSDVAIGHDGAIYVSDDGVNSVYRFER